jgi:hypothetical protein
VTTEVIVVNYAARHLSHQAKELAKLELSHIRIFSALLLLAPNALAMKMSLRSDAGHRNASLKSQTYKLSYFHHEHMNSSLLADGVWPSLILEAALLSPAIILIGLIIEGGVLHFAFDLSWKKAAWVDVVMNSASTVAGAVLIPAGGMVLTFRGFVEIHYLLWYLIGVALSTATEAAVLRWIFKIPLHRWRLWILCGANGLSAGIAVDGLISRMGIVRVEFP